MVLLDQDNGYYSTNAINYRWRRSSARLRLESRRMTDSRTILVSGGCDTEEVRGRLRIMLVSD